MTTRDLLIEIGTEELPPKALSSLSGAFEDLITTALRAENLFYNSSQKFATPRRLAILLKDLAEYQEDKELFRVGPAVTAAYDKDGNPTQAAIGFAKSCGVDLNKLETDTKNGVEKLVFHETQKGRHAKTIIPEIIKSSLPKLPTPKRMRWGSSREEFVRPIHWILLLFGRETLSLDLFGVESGNHTRGHRFHNNGEILVEEPAKYEEILREEGQVIANFEKRKELIRSQVIEQGDLVSAEAIIEEGLLSEVTSLVEFPSTLSGKFDSEFLEVPPEAIVLTMKTHQKCFHLHDKEGHLLPYFVAVSNIKSKDPNQVIKGNERVIRPRLADAKFFFDTDRKYSLESRLDQLKKLIFQDKLGSVFDKAIRVSKISRSFARKLSGNEAYCERAALLSKCDLLTDMVREFSDLQGIVGGYYATYDGEPKEIAEAIQEQYRPKFSGDRLPIGATGVALAVSDKIDTMVSLFGINQPPTGSKDPFALRRAAIGVLRIIVEKELDLNLLEVVNVAIKAHCDRDLAPDTGAQVFQFLLERFRSWYHDEGVASNVYESVYALRPQRPHDFHLRIKAVSAFNALPESNSLAAANKRVENLLSKHKEESIDDCCKENLLDQDSEKKLYEMIQNKKLELAPLIMSRDYTAALLSLSSLKPTIDDFFDNILVITEDKSIRENRLSLLQELRHIFLEIADISFLESGLE